MFLRRVAILPFIALLFWSVSFAQETAKQAREANYVSDIRQVDFRNFTYKRDESAKEAETVELLNGRHTRSDGAWTSFMRVAYGDLTGDGSDEAVVLLRGQNTRISRTLDEVFIFTLKDGKLSEIAHFEGGRRGDYILSVESLGSNFKVEGETLILDQAVLREGEYVPTRYYTVKYRWNGTRMVETERSALKLIPEGWKEEG
ncbi:MAG: hypothetical protein M3362_07130 [Acidobacteriota bacterium]|nr:hypothetical protein [Acidobacteriota bacterium]